ncbi:interleukin-7 receptor subunit alpha [Hippocampus comes]|uniref:Interleukin 7 receptor n=1 Tax=Hippocampus comes TaxID=109280 RepID=A0A3Q2YAL0_HIPCM|nr:PREDICTED: interleukin-7 receptor subunit alpha [Hippocampus comes]XP_019737988.1 PREDICTED: interleukin-7 receptor subunit alpha [Hippocampus comes]
MLFGCRMVEQQPLLLPMLPMLLLLLPVACLAQSGDGDTDLESRISCTSHITTVESSLTCKLTGSRSEDDEDQAEGVESMTVCFTKVLENKLKCLTSPGDSITSAELNALAPLKLTILLKGGATINKTVKLNKIIKPRSPEVWNVTVKHESNQAVFHIRTPYLKDYLKVENQLFQLVIWTADKNMIQNVSASDTMAIDMEHLQINLKYHVKVRAIPLVFLRGSWSEWSNALTFSIPDGRTQSHEREKVTTKLIACFLSLVVLTSTLGYVWKKKVFSYMWPSIPHPKPTMVHGCKPNQVALLLTIKPEEVSTLKIYPVVERVEQERVLAIHCAANDLTLASYPASTQNSDCSTGTEELELSISRNSSCFDGDDSLQSTNSPLVETAAPNPGHSISPALGAHQKEEDYVTMSSFYQVK